MSLHMSCQYSKVIHSLQTIYSHESTQMQSYAKPFNNWQLLIRSYGMQIVGI